MPQLIEPFAEAGSGFLKAAEPEPRWVVCYEWYPRWPCWQEQSPRIPSPPEEERGRERRPFIPLGPAYEMSAHKQVTRPPLLQRIQRRRGRSPRCCLLN